MPRSLTPTTIAVIPLSMAKKPISHEMANIPVIGEDTMIIPAIMERSPLISAVFLDFEISNRHWIPFKIDQQPIMTIQTTLTIKGEKMDISPNKIRTTDPIMEATRHFP